jgi:hypothetical protein
LVLDRHLDLGYVSSKSIAYCIRAEVLPLPCRPVNIISPCGLKKSGFILYKSSTYFLGASHNTRFKNPGFFKRLTLPRLTLFPWQNLTQYQKKTEPAKKPINPNRKNMGILKMAIKTSAILINVSNKTTPS